MADYRNQEMENRIRALYAQILEKDAVIKILNQRLHQDQGRKDEHSPRPNLLNTVGASLRPASSTPSISTALSNTRSRGKQQNVAYGSTLYIIFKHCLWVKMWIKDESTSDRHCCSLGKSLSDDQTLPSHQFSAQSEPGTLELQVEGTKAKEAASTTKLNSGE